MDNKTGGNETHVNDLQNPFSSVPIEITVSVGKARPLIRDLLKLGKNAVLVLDRRVDDAVELEELAGDQQGQIAVRVTEVANLQDGL